MLRSHLAKLKLGQLICIIGVEIFVLAILMSSLTKVALASPYLSLSPQDTLSPPSLQITPTVTLQPTPQLTQTVQEDSQDIATPPATLQIDSTSIYSFSLATLGYEEVTLVSPFRTINYSFGLPQNWLIQTDGILNLDLSYVYTRIIEEDNAALFGDLTIIFDNQTIETFPFEEEMLDHYRLSVRLPLSLFADSDQTRHTLRLRLDATSLCDVPHEAKLVIHPTSSITLGYDERPLVPDLSHYPRPFYQQAFNSADSVRFVLPSQPTTEDLSNALAIAAKLGDLTNKNLVISTTTDIDLSQILSSTSTVLNEHFIVIGKPQDNRLLSLLNDISELPVSLHQRQLDLVAQGPVTVTPGDILTYTFTVTNTIDRDVELSLASQVSAFTKFSDCTPSCTKNDEDNNIIWSKISLAPADTLNFILTLKTNEVLTGTVLENTVTLMETDLGPINSDTIVSAIETASTTNKLQRSTNKEDYFFVFNGQAVAEADGIVQEILSPWNENRAILIVTGLNDEAVRKASQTMSSAVRFPGLKGPVALVKDISNDSVGSQVTATAIERDFADLGYNDQIVQGGETVQEIDYWFEVPYGWRLTEDAFIELYFSHSQLIDYQDSGLTLLLNRQPFASAALSEETAANGFLRVSLKDANIRPGNFNRLTIQVDAAMLGQCVDSTQAWVLIKNISKIFLAHREETGLGFDLEGYPYPFQLNPSLTDLLFALPDTPVSNDIENALRLVAALGDSAAGETILPSVVLRSDPLPEDLSKYHIIALGRPSRNTLIQEINAQLPQPFLPNSDQIDQQLDDVILRLPPNIELGYIQLLSSPWDEGHALLAITGTTDQSVTQAVDILINRTSALRGNLALVTNDNEINTIDTRPLTHRGVAAAIATAIPETSQINDEAQDESPASIATKTLNTPTPSPNSPNTDTSTSEQISTGTTYPIWLIFVVVTTGLIVIAIFAFVFWRSRR